MAAGPVSLLDYLVRHGWKAGADQPVDEAEAARREAEWHSALGFMVTDLRAVRRALICWSAYGVPETFGCPVGAGRVSVGGGWRQVGRAVANGLTFGELERRVALVRVVVAAGVEEAEVAATEHAVLSDGSTMASGADALATVAVRESTMRRLAEGGAVW